MHYGIFATSILFYIASGKKMHSKVSKIIAIIFLTVQTFAFCLTILFLEITPD